MNKKGPILLLLVLFLVLVFVVGIRYGQKVEETNKVIKYLVSLPPSPTPVKPTALGFKTYENKTCGVSFLYPSELKLKNATLSADFRNKKDVQEISINCDQTSKLVTNEGNSEYPATSEAVFQDKTIEVGTINNGTFYVFFTTNPLNGRKIFFGVLKNLYPLFERTLQFTR